MEQWEYKKLNRTVVSISLLQQRDDTLKLMNELGQEGWELVGVTSYDNGTGMEFYFKRKAPQ